MADDNTTATPDADLPAPKPPRYFADGPDATPAPGHEPPAEQPVEPPAEQPAEQPAEAPSTPRADLGSTSPWPSVNDNRDPAVAQRTQLIPTVGPEPVMPSDPQAGQYTQLVPPVAPVPAGADATTAMPFAQPPRLPLDLPTVVAGSRVVIVVSRGAAQIPTMSVVGVPHVIGMSQGEALSQLQQAGLSSQVFNDCSPLPRGEVIGQLPQYGQTAPAGSEAVLLVSGGPAPASALAVPLPDVVGLTEADALGCIQAAGLLPQVVRDFSPTVPLGFVAAQLPSARAATDAVPAKKKLGLWWLWLLLACAAAFAAAGGAYYWLNRTAIVPNVTGMTKAAAEKAIKAAGFKVGSIGTTQTISAALVGKVASQTPPPNTEFKLVGQVDIVISGGQKMVLVPDVTGKPEAEARSELTLASLAVSATPTYSSSVPTGSVISQSPAAGQSVPGGTMVGLAISTGTQTPVSTTPVTTPTTPVTPTFKVPNVVGKSSSSAKSTLTAAGFPSTTTTAYSSTVSKGDVIAQSPGADTMYAKNTTVLLTVSSGAAPLGNPTMPSVINLSQSKATSTITGGRLKLLPVVKQGTYTSTKSGHVLFQYPAAGTTLNPNTKVLIVVSTGAPSPSAESTKVPTVNGAAEHRTTAQNTLADNHLGNSIVYWSGTTVAAGYVAGQIPDPGVTVPLHTSVVLIIAK